MGWKRSVLEGVCWLTSRFSPRSKTPPESPKSIFILRNNGIGDLILTTPLFSMLKERFPKSRIVVGTGWWAYDVLRDNPNVDEILPLNAPWGNYLAHPQTPRGALSYIYRSTEAEELTRRGFDVGIDVLGSGYGSLLLMRAKIPWRIGVKGYAGGHSAAQQWVQYHEEEHVISAVIRQGALLTSQTDVSRAPQIFLDTKPDQHGAIVLVPGGGFAEKCWPLDNYKELVSLLAPHRIIVAGTKEEAALGSALALVGSHVENRCGLLSLRETFKLIAGASAVVCNSSMAMHAAAAFKRPCLVLLGIIYPSASLHMKQWGHPETVIMGRDSDVQEICTPAKALAIMKEKGMISP